MNGAEAEHGRAGGKRTASVVLLALVLALLVRAPVLTATFPVNDGALFHEMIAAIRANGYRLPPTVAWNGEALPFCYPPLSFYATAAIADVGGADLLFLLRVLPLLFNLATVAAGIFVIRRLAAPEALLGAAVLLAFQPHAFEWLVMGGGIARSPGFLLAVLAWIQALRYAESRRRPALATAALFVAAAGATHLEWGVDAAVGLAIFVLSRRPDRRGVAAVAVAGLLALAASSPWWATAIARHGVAPFLSAAGASHWSLAQGVSDLLLLRPFTHEHFITYYLGLPALAGSLSRLSRRSYLLPLWHLQFFFLTPRHAREAASIPVAILAAEGILVLADLCRRPLTGPGTLRRALRTAIHRGSLLAVFGLLCGLMGLSAWMQGATPLHSLADDEVAAMRHIAAHTPPTARFVVLSRATRWADDRHAEWFPVLARRRSLATIQGVEWLPGAAYWRRAQEVEGLRNAQRAGAAELARYLALTYPQHDHVAVFDHATAPDASLGSYEKLPSPSGVRILRRSRTTTAVASGSHPPLTPFLLASHPGEDRPLLPRGYNAAHVRMESGRAPGRCRGTLDAQADLSRGVQGP